MMYLNGGFPLSCVLCANGRQSEVCSHEVLLGAVELLDAPNRGILKIEKTKKKKRVKIKSRNKKWRPVFHDGRMHRNYLVLRLLSIL